MNDPPQGRQSTSRDTACSDDDDDEIIILEHIRSERPRVTIYDSDEDSEMNLQSDEIPSRHAAYRKRDETMSDDMEDESELSVDTDSEDEDEDDDEEEEEEEDSCIECSDDDEDWAGNGSFRKFVFHEKSGVRGTINGPEPYHYFELLFDRSFFLNIVEQTNVRANDEQWRPLTVEEFKIFFALILHMGVIKCPYLQYYWNSQRLFNFSCFSQHMSRNRFQQILRCLRFSTARSGVSRLNKIQPIVDYFNDKMRRVYYPSKELSMSERVVTCKGRLLSRKRITGKGYRYGEKLYVLSECTGVTLRVKVHEKGDEDVDVEGHAIKVVLHLLRDFLQKGHSVHMDNSFNGLELTKRLLDARTYCTGVLGRLRKRSKGDDVAQTKLAKGEIVCRYKNNVMVGRFRSNREVAFISSEFKANPVELDDKRGEKYKRPLALYKYKVFTRNVEKKGQMLTYYSSLRKTFKWYVKLWIHIVETLLLNAYLLYVRYSSSQKKTNFLLFRLDIIKLLLSESPKEHASLVFVNQHLSEMLPRDSKNKVQRKRCRQCYANGLRKSTSYYCSGCTNRPGLCLGECFREYHRSVL